MPANLVLQLNLSTMATLRTRESGHYKKMAIVERFKQEFMYGLIVAAVEGCLFQRGGR